VRTLPVDGGTPSETVTDATGAFTLTVPSGRWLVSAAAGGYQSQWHPGKSNPFEAQALDLADGAVVALAFDLVPSPAALVAGCVTRPDGSPVAHAVVMAVPCDGASADGSSPGRGPAVFAGDEGCYALRLTAGVYAFAVAPDWRTEPTTWWFRQPAPGQADRLPVADGQLWQGVDFVLP
jgi:hypothetical protein